MNPDAVVGEEVFTKDAEPAGKAESKGTLVAVFGTPIGHIVSDLVA